MAKKKTLICNEYKTCVKCNINKHKDEFNKCNRNKCGMHSYCKLCRKTDYNNPESKAKSKAYYLKNFEKNKESTKIRASEWYKNNKNKAKETRKCFYENNKDSISKKKKEYRQKNPEQYKNYNKRYYLENINRKKESNRLYKIKNRKKVNENNRKWLRARMKDPIYKLNKYMSQGVYFSLKKMKNGQSWSTLVDYSLNELKSHLESLFTTNMSWDNYGKYGWHLEHILPICSFKIKEAGDEEFKKCWSLNNLRPLWATTDIAIANGENEDYIGNLNKGGKITNG